MRKSRFTEEQILRILHEAAEGKVGEVIRRYGITVKTDYRWKAKFAGMQVSNAKRLVAEQALDNVILKDLVKKFS